MSCSSKVFHPLSVMINAYFVGCGFKVHCAITVKIWCIDIVVHSSIHSTAHPCIPAPTCQYIHLSIYSFDHPSMHLCTLYPFTYPFDHSSTHLPVWSSIHPSIHLSTHPPSHPSTHPPCIHSHVLLIIHLSIHPSLPDIREEKPQRIREEKQVTIRCWCQDHHRKL